MPQESERESLIKMQVNTLVDYLVNAQKYTYDDAMRVVLGSDTYRLMTESKSYLNQGRTYILNDLKEELAQV